MKKIRQRRSEFRLYPVFMERIYPAAKDFDIVVSATPLHCWNMGGQLREAIDLLFALEEEDRNFFRGNGRA